ncbi:MAG: hypothetical protein DHS20C18_01100 [Saprospiraceae bacterium]|nr:MAG: hypothetical protein DHS20C18_01100 [Saprospiraceae bacterium]
MKKKKQERILQEINILEKALEKSKAKTRKARRRYHQAKRRKEAIKFAIVKKKNALIPKPKPENAPQELNNEIYGKPMSGRPSTSESLCLIRGIGPKIEKLLLRAGINSFETLASFNPEQLKQILAEAGPQFRHYDPTDWLIQARDLTKQVDKKMTDSSESPPKSSGKVKK